MIRRIALALSLLLLVAGCGLLAPEEEAPIKVEVDHVIGGTAGATADGPSPGILREAWRADVRTIDRDGPDFLMAEGRLLAFSSDGVDAHDGATGRALWHYREPGRRRGQFVVTGGVVVLTSSGEQSWRAVALSLDTGRLLWQRTPTGRDDLRTLAAPLAAGKGVVLTEQGAEHDVAIAGIDARSGQHRWTADLTPGPDCELRLPLTTQGTGDGSLALVEEDCPDGHPRFHALDPATGDVRWTRERPADSLLVVHVTHGITMLVTQDGQAAFVGPDGERWPATGAVATCGPHPCRPLTVRDRLVVPSLGAGTEPRLTIIDTVSGRTKDLALTGDYWTWTGGPDRVYGLFTRPANVLPGLPQLWTAAIDPAAGTVEIMPLPTHLGPVDMGGVRLIGTAGHQLLTAIGDRATRGVTVIAYDSAPTTGPLQSGGVPPEDWPDCRTLLRRGAELSPDPDPIEFGALKLRRPTCRHTVAGEGDVSVQVVWVAARAQEADALLDGVPGAPPGPDETYTSATYEVIRVGRTIVLVHGEPGARARAITTVTENLRSHGPRD
ncbi:outer membrane protein assembly factor BamB family protein [Nonomuraea sp. NPDC004297]